MINELIVLADELDQCGERQAADIIDKLVKTAVDAEFDKDYLENLYNDPEAPLTPLKPEADEDEYVPEALKEFAPDEKTQVSFEAVTGAELIARLKNFFATHPSPVRWSDGDRAKTVEALQTLIKILS